MRSILRNTHKYLSLAVVALWALQFLTGVLISFRGEIDDALLSGPARPLDPLRFGAAVASITAAHPGMTPAYVMASEGSPNRYDVLLADADGRLLAVRTDGVGSVLRERPYDYDYPAPGLLATAHDIHETLLAGDRGKLILAVSGCLLLSNLLVALCLAWPGRNQGWRRVLAPGFSGPFAANVFKWHRALGLIVVAPAIVIVTCGAAQQLPVDDWLGVQGPDLRAPAHADGATTLGSAISTALARHPGSTLAIVSMPDADSPWYRIRMRDPGEIRRVYGKSVVAVDARDGAVLLDRPAGGLPLNERIANAFYPIHNGEFAGLFGRVVSLLTGVGLLAMVVLGLAMWWTRRRARRQPRPALQPRTATR